MDASARKVDSGRRALGCRSAGATLARACALALASLSLVNVLRAETPTSASVPRKKAIAWGGIDWYSPATVQLNIRKIEELPFDGTVLQGFKANKDGKEVMFDWLCFGRERFEREQLAETIETLKNIDYQRFTDNFLRYNVTPGDVDWFDDFDAILHNARMWAEVTKETGMKGWAFDVEDYRHTVFEYRKMRYGSQKSFEEYAAQARLRGSQFMEAVQSGNPEIVILLMLAHSYVNKDVQAGQPLQEHEYGLLPAFVDGMLEAAGPQARLIDGQEQAYGYLTAEDHFRGYHGARQQALALVPPELHADYRNKMDVAVALYVDYLFALTDYPGHWPTHFISVDDRLRLFEQSVYNSLSTADEYAWIYTERLSWWEPGGGRFPTPDGALEAIRSARDKVRGGQPLGFDMAERVASARLKQKEASPVFPARESILLQTPTGQPGPVTDGVLDDAVWATASPLHPFVPLKASANGAEAATSVQATFDGERLYIAFRCGEPAPDRLISPGEKKDDDIWRGDCVEVLLRAGEGTPPYHFIVNPRNVQWDGRGDVADWNAEWRSGAHVGTDQWTVEIAIPWSSIGVEPGSPYGARASFVRRRAATNDLTALVQDLSATVPAP